MQRIRAILSQFCVAFVAIAYSWILNGLFSFSFNPLLRFLDQGKERKLALPMYILFLAKYKQIFFFD